jgi:hypothetical protein
MVAAYAAAFADQGPTNPRFAFEARGDEVVVKMTASDRGQVVNVIEQALRPVPNGTTPNRFKAFAHGTAMAARQIAPGHEPGDLAPDEVFCLELLSVPELGTADGFRRAIMDEGGTRTRVRARLETEELAREHGLPVPDAAGQVLLYQVLDPYSEQDLADQCDALRKVVGERPDLLPHLAVVAKGWADDPDAWWPGEPETDISGPRLLAGVLTVLLPNVAADQRKALQAALARIGRVPTEEQLTDLGIQ